MSELMTRSIIVKAPVEEVYQTWADFENFPNFMEHIKSVKMTGDRTSHWTMEGPMGRTIEWNAVTTMLEENKRIGWSTKDDEESDVTTSGQVSFNPLSDEETEVTAIVNYEPKGGIAGDVVEKLFANPIEKLDEDLRNFKAYMEGMYERTGSKR